MLSIGFSDSDRPTCAEQLKNILTYGGSLQYRFYCHASFESQVQIMNIQNSRKQRKHYRPERRGERMYPEFQCDLFANQNAYEKNFWSSHEEQNQNRVLALKLAVLGHVIFPRNHTRVDIGLLQFQEQIKQGHIFIPALQADTTRAMCILKMTLPTHLECCISPLQVRFLEYLVACRLFVMKGVLQGDLIRAYPKRISSKTERIGAHTWRI